MQNNVHMLSFPIFVMGSHTWANGAHATIVWYEVK
jgi:hypothetical protein